ncbi:sulfatase-like hydrolase/transferase [Pediococcus argentinicus]|uniref:sulfatase-like hydrolase/transferase n=1 Tax=Pediococcus argentinicus TaxID=480391 RepID=UPI00338DBFC3
MILGIDKDIIIKRMVLIFTMALIMVTSIVSYSNWSFLSGSLKGLGIENLLFLRPVVSNIILLLFASSIKKVSWRTIKEQWGRLLFYAVFLTLFAFAVVMTRYSWWQFLQASSPVVLQSSFFSAAIIGVLMIHPLLKNQTNTSYLKWISLMGFFIFSLVPTFISSTHLISPLQQAPSGIFWGALIAIFVKSEWTFKITQRFRMAVLLAVVFSFEVLIFILNRINIESSFFWSGFSLLKHISLSNVNIVALLMSILLFNILNKSKNIFPEVQNYLIAGVLVGNHILFSNPLWNDIFQSYKLSKQSSITLFGNIFFYAITVALLVILVEWLRQSSTKALINKQHSWQLGILSSFIITLIGYIILLVANSMGDINSLMRVAGHRPYIMLLNVFLLFLINVILFAIINRVFISSIISMALVVSLAFGNYQKILARNEPITPIDISSNIKNISQIMDLVNVWLVVVLLIMFVIIIVGSIWIEKKLKVSVIFNWLQRLIMSIAGLGVLIFFIFKLPNVPSSSVTWKSNDKTFFNETLVQKLDYDFHPENVWFDFKLNGPVTSFMSRIRIPIMDKPTGYSEKSINTIVNKYNNVAKNINLTRKNNIKNDVVIYILSESFANPNRVPGVKTASNPIPYTDYIKRENTSGIMDSYGYGGGTADMEFESLSGLSLNNFSPSLSTPYVELMPKVTYMPSVLDLFNTKNAIHPYQPNLYNRVNVFKKFGFSKFYNTNYPYKVKYTNTLEGSKYISDLSAYKQLNDVLKENKGGQFIQLSTMQNHMPYMKNEYNKNFNVTANKLTNASKAKLETYTEGIHESDKALKYLISAINKDKRNISVVFYGDHLPGLYEWKKDNDAVMAKNDSLMHQTDYFIYSNHNKNKVKKEVTAPYMFTPMMLKQNNAKVSAYYALLTECMENLPAGERGKYMLSNGKEVKESHLSTKQKQLLLDYRLVQFDISSGNHYLKKDSSFFKTR